MIGCSASLKKIIWSSEIEQCSWLTSGTSAALLLCSSFEQGLTSYCNCQVVQQMLRVFIVTLNTRSFEFLWSASSLNTFVRIIHFQLQFNCNCQAQVLKPYGFVGCCNRDIKSLAGTETLQTFSVTSELGLPSS